MPGSTDESLVRRIAEGDRKALGELYDRYIEDLMAVGRKFLDDDGMVEETIHELFVEVWKKAHTYEPDRGSVHTWLMVRMRSRALDKVRYETRRDHERLAEAVDGEALVAEEAPGEAAERDWVRHSLEGLPERLREVLVCTYYYGMTGAETAEKLEIPVGTVRSRLASAREALETRLTRADEGADE